jgi:hypothetical protein
MFRSLTKFRRFFAASMLLGLCLCACGCSTWGYKPWGWGTSEDDGFSDEDRRFTEGLRPMDKHTKSTATTAKGREIDRSFGIGGK